MSSRIHPKTWGTQAFVSLAAVGAVLWLMLSAILSVSWGQIGADPDDVMRFIQIRDWLSGQSWFETDQSRLGPGAGTDMHWSRLPDIPIAILTLVFDIFLPRETAMHVAASVWPPVIGGLFLLVLARGAKAIAPDGQEKPVVIVSLVLGLFYVVMSKYFNPGVIDHHNLQILFGMAAISGLVNPDRFSSGLMSGGALALCVAIGGEAYAFAGLICVFIAMDWAVNGSSRRARTQGFGLGFGLGVAFLFLLTVAPKSWSLTYCDQLSDITILCAVTGGIGLTAAATLFSDKTWFWRWTSLGGIGVASLSLLLGRAPQCLSNPLDALPDRVQTYWLDNVTEAKPLLKTSMPALIIAPYLIGTGLIALIVLCFQSFKYGFKSNRLVFIILLAVMIPFAFYQIRFSFFVNIIAILPLALWVGTCFILDRESGRGVSYIFALAVSIPQVLGGVGAVANGVLDSDYEIEEATASNCLTPEIMTGLMSQTTGLMLAPQNESAEILKATSHRVLNGNYHRNVVGNSAQIDIWLSPPSDALLLLQNHNVDYVFYCKTMAGMGLYYRDAPKGFASLMKAGEYPTWLTPTDVEGLYRINAK